MENNTSISNDLEMHPSRRNEASTFMVVIIDESFTSPSFDDEEDGKDLEDFKTNKQVRKQDD